MSRFFFSIITASTLFLGISTKGQAGIQPADLGPLKHIKDASKELQKAAKAVVRIKLESGEAGTGFFISQNGFMVTNAHVVGPSNCSREGCYLEIDHDLAVGSETREEVVFALPLATFPLLDATILQLRVINKDYKPTATPGTIRVSNRHGRPIETPEYLRFSTKIPGQLKDGTSYVIGHPFAGLKRWNEGETFQMDGDWCTSTHCAAPGNSGSPIVDSKGLLTGLIHRSGSSMEGVLDLNQLAHISQGFRYRQDPVRDGRP
jgi:hypothetical protein